MGFLDSVARYFQGDTFRKSIDSSARFAVASATEAHRKHLNEDASYADAKTGLIGLADGVTGSGGGAEASGGAMAALREFSPQIDRVIADEKRKNGEAAELGIRIESALAIIARKAGDRIDDLVRAASKEGRNERPHATFVTAKTYETAPGKFEAVVARIGNSRAFVLRHDGRVERVEFELPGSDNDLKVIQARDGVRPDQGLLSVQKHEQIEGLRRKFSFDDRETEILDQATSIDQMDERAREYYSNNLDLSVSERLEKMKTAYGSHYGGGTSPPKGLQVMGNRSETPMHVQTSVQKNLRPGDAIVLCSDGITDALTEMDMRELAERGGTLQEIADRWKTEAVRRMRSGESKRAKEDDATVQAMEIPGGEPRASKVLPERLANVALALKKSQDRSLILNKDKFNNPNSDDHAERVRAASLASFEGSALEARMRIQEILQIIRHEGMSEYWKKRLDARKGEYRKASEIFRTAKSEAKETLLKTQAESDKEKMDAVHADIERITNKPAS